MRIKAVKKKEYDVLKIYMKLYIYAGILMGLAEVIRYESLGEAAGMPLHTDRLDMILLLILQTASLAVIYPLFLAGKDRGVRLKGLSDYRFEINDKRVHTVTFLILAAELIFTLRTGNAVIGRVVTSRLSFLFNMIKISAWMPLYYVCARDTKKPLYWCNVLLYLMYEFLCGWSGQIIQLVFFELFLFVKHGKALRMLKSLFQFSSLLTAAAFVAGSFLYSYVFSLKNSIRYSVPFGSIEPLGFVEGAKQLLSRFTNYPITVAAFQNHERIAQLYRLQNKPFWELESILSPLVPRFLMPNKEYRPLGNLVKQAIWEDNPKGTGTGYNFFMYWANIFECNLGCFVAGIAVFAVLAYISKQVIFAFDNGSKDTELLYFFFLFGIMSETGLSRIFGYGYISLIYTIPFLIVTGAVKIKKIRFAAMGQSVMCCQKS